jgi:hypothetical protein
VLDSSKADLEMDFVKCNSCGTEIVFCPYCGEKLTNLHAAAQTTLSDKTENIPPGMSEEGLQYVEGIQAKRRQYANEILASGLQVELTGFEMGLLRIDFFQRAEHNAKYFSQPHLRGTPRYAGYPKDPHEYVRIMVEDNHEIEKSTLKRVLGQYYHEMDSYWNRSVKL